MLGYAQTNSNKENKMDPIDEAFARKDRRQAIVVIIIFALVGANGYLIENNVLRSATNIVLFNIAILLLLFLAWIKGVIKLYETNLRKPGVSKATAAEAAFEGREIDARCS